MTELLIKNIISEILFGNRICESLEDKYVVDYLYEELMLEKLLYGEPITIEELRKLLRDKIVNFEFIKLNGEKRPARGTLMMKYIPQDQHPKGIRPSSPKVATFYDLDKKDWRSVSQKSKEIVLKKDEEKGKPVIMVKEKPEGEPEAEKEKETTKIEEPANIKQEQPKSEPEEVKTFYLVNPKIGASKTVDTTLTDVMNMLKKMGSDWKFVNKDEFDRMEKEISQKNSKNITDTLSQNKEKEIDKNTKTNVSPNNIINKEENLDNKKASEI